MTTVTIQDFQGINAEFDLGQPLTMLSGSNGSGKTRIARALGAVLSVTAAPITGKKSDLRECLTAGGSDRASVVLRNGHGHKAMVWADGRCEPSVKGPQDRLPRASKYACGLVSLLELSGKERAAGFAETFKTDPGKQELLHALQQIGTATESFEELWEHVELSGWDAVATDAQAQARALKAGWREVTGRDWGERIAETWEPDAKHFADPADLQQAIDQTRDGLERAKQAVEAAQATRAMLPERVDDIIGQPCPWCEKPVMFRRGKLEKAEQEERNSNEVREIRLAIATADGKLAHARDHVYHQERLVGAAEARIADAAKARDQAKSRAAELHKQIGEQLEIAKICGPAGLRKTKLEDVLEIVNRDLAGFAQDASLPLLQIGLELDATLDGTPYHRLSRAQSWLARTIMQIEIAGHDQSNIIVVDDLDVVADPKDRNAVLSAIVSQSLTAVVLQAAWNASDAQRTPDLAASGYGATYWLDTFYDDVVDPETGEVLGQRINESRLLSIAEMRGAKMDAA